MNTYIVNPMIFYWLNVASSLKIALLIAAITAGIALTCYIVAWACCAHDVRVYPKNSDGERESMPIYLKMIKRLSIAVIVLVAFLVFIPDRDTILYMMIAKMATFENAGLTVDAIKSAVDYIVAAMSEIR